MPDRRRLRLTTWNLQGRAQPDLDAVIATIRRLGPDVVVLQEVQRRQAARLAGRLGWFHVWTWKHWPIVHRPEGLAIVSAQPIHGRRRWSLAAGWRFWSWRRRVALGAHVHGFTVVNVHLGAGVGGAERRRQAAVVGAEAGARGAARVVAGDLNTRPGSSVIDAFAAWGLVDASTRATRRDIVGEGATNWRAERTAPPDQTLDFVLVDPCVTVASVGVADGGESDWAAYGALSDHVPVTVDVLR